MGKLIIFEGLDGSGKGTQTKLTADHLRQRGADLRQITFPNYESNSSALVKMYLAGEFGEHPDDVNAYAASSFYAVDRFASYKTDWGEFYREGGLVLSDRYTTSNAVPPVLQTAADALGRIFELAVRFRVQEDRHPDPG